MIRPPPPKEGTDYIPEPRRQVKQAGLDRAHETEARIQDVADGRQETVHIPDKTRARDRHSEEVRVAEELDDAPGISHAP